LGAYLINLKIPGFTPDASDALLLAVGLVSFFTLLFWTWAHFKPSNTLTNIKDRIVAWWVIIAIYALLMGIHPWVTAFGFATISFLAFRELVSRIGVPAQMRKTVFWAYLAIPVQYALALHGEILPFVLFIPVAMLFLLPFRTIIEGIYEDSIKTFSQLYWALMLTVYCISHVAFLSFLPNVPGHSAGQQGTVFFLVFLTQMCDVFQYLSGKVFGRHKITPRISPNKTWEGFIGGFIATIGMGVLLSHLVPLALPQTLVLAAMIAFFGFFGDLNISSIKRDLNIKDMSDFIPGHGGVLDRLDSLIFSSLAFFYTFYYLVYA
jgi:phosphatidate cytidylyltransferase